MKFFENARVGKNHWLLYVAILVLGYIAAQIPAILFIFALIIDKKANGGNRQAIREMLDDGNMNAFFDTIPGFIVTILTFVVWLGATWWLFKLFHKRERMTLISGEKKFRKKNFFMGIGAFTIAYGLFWLVSFPLLYSVIGTDFQFDGGRYFVFATIALILLPFQTGSEELIFRGYLMQGLALCTKSKVWALVITSVVFGLMHGCNGPVEEYGFFTAIPVYVFIGFELGLFAILSDGIELPWGIHYASNLIAFTIIGAKSEGTVNVRPLIQVDEPVWVMYILEIGVFAIMFLLLRKKMGWDIKKAFDNSGLKNNVPPPYFA